jgi:dTDP-4-amino-4,6-dideoxygalactose transaminase
MTIPQYRPSIKRKDMDAVLSCMVADALGPGATAAEFAAQLAKQIRCAGGVALRDHARAIDLVLSVLALEAGSRVVLSPLIPALYDQVLRQRGIEPVYVDVCEDNPTLDLEQAAAVPDVHAVFLDTPLGYVSKLDTLDGQGLTLIEDVSLGLGGTREGEPVGSHGRYTIAAFEARHIVTTGGGAAAFAKSTKQRTALRAAARDLPVECSMPDMNGALGNTQLRELEYFVTRRRELEEQFAEALQRSRHRRPVPEAGTESVPSGFAVLVESGGNEVIAYAKKHGVDAAYAFDGSVLARNEAVQQLSLPNAGQYYLRTLAFPLYPALGKREVEQIQRVLSTLP